MGFSTGRSPGTNFISNMANSLLSGVNDSGSAESLTRAAVSDGSITVRDTAAQTQDVANLSRDVAHANQTLSPIFDLEKEQNRLQASRLISEIGSQAIDAARTQGDINGLEAARKAHPGLSDDALRKTDTYRAVMEKFGTGSAIQKGIQAATAALQGLAGGNVSGAIAGASAPYLAGIIHDETTSKDANGKDVVDAEANLMAHAVLGAVVATASGNSGLAGAAGGVAGEAVAQEYLMQQLYPGVDREELNEEQKQTISALSTLAAGLAGGVAGGSTADAVTGAQAGKNAVENNALGAKDEKQRQDAKWSLPYLEGEKKQQAEQLVSNLNAKSEAFDANLDAACKNLSSAQCQGMRQELAAMGRSYDEKLDGQYIGTMASVYKEGADKVDSLLWQYATADAQAQKAKDIQTIATNWGVSPEMASALYTGMSAVHTTAAIGGAVYGMKGVGSSEQTAGSIKNVNPGYPESGRTHNCVNCSVATDATLAGNPATALPINSTKGVPLSVLEQQYGTKFKYVSSSDSITQQMTNAGSGSRGIVYGSYGPGQPGHVFNVVNQNGTIRYLDGQTGKPADLTQFKSFQLLRTN